MGNCCSNQSKERGDAVKTFKQEGVLFAMGNPLLDIVITVTPAFLQKYDLQRDQIVLINDEKRGMYKQMLTDILENDVGDIQYVLGGAAQNTIRVAQWIIGYPRAAVFMGAIGNDEFGKVMFEEAVREGIIGEYQIVESQPTGTCAVLVTGKHRALVACISAAQYFSKEFLRSTENFMLVERAKFYYVTGFFLTVVPECVLLLAQYSAVNDKTFCLNLSAEYISTQYIKELNAVMPYVDILFGNKLEALAFATSQNFGTSDIGEIGLKTVKLPKANEKVGRLVVLTQGHHPVVIASGNNIQTFKVPSIRDSEIKDLNGAGDAFVGGFLAQYIQGYSLDISVQCANWAAAEVIKSCGCTFPKEKSFMPTYHP